MKRSAALIILFIVLAGTCTDALSQGSRLSFRMKGLGPNLVGFVDDNYSDLFLNPYFINRFTKRTIFTNLSNLQSSEPVEILRQDDEKSFENMIFPSNLIGAIGKFRNYPFGAFWESSGYSIKYDKENVSRGTYTVSPTVTIDTVKTDISELNGNFSTRTFSLFSQFRDIGFYIAYNKGGFELDYNEDNSIVTQDTAGTTGRDRTKISRNLKFPGSAYSFVVGKVFKAPRAELSFSLGMRPERLAISSSYIFSVFNKPFFGGGEGELSEIEDNDFGTMEIPVKSMFVNARYKTVETSAQNFKQINYTAQLSRYKLPLDWSSEKNVETNEYFFDVDDDTVSIHETQNMKTSGSGSATVYHFQAGFGGEYHFDNLKSMSALGLKLSYIRGNLDFQQNPGINTLSHNEVNSDTLKSDSYSRTESDNRTVVTKGSASGLILNIPVGLETKLTDKLTIRLGANTMIPLFFKGDWNTEDTDGQNQMVSGDSTNYVSDTTIPVFDSEKVGISGKLLNLTQYYFGASYQVTESIRIDFLHFAKLTDLDTWWLSIVLKH